MPYHATTTFAHVTYLQCSPNAARDHAQLSQEAAGKGNGGQDELVVYEDLIGDDTPKEPNLEDVEAGGDEDGADGADGDGPARRGQASRAVGPRHDAGGGGVDDGDKGPERGRDSRLGVGTVVGVQVVAELPVLLAQAPVVQSAREQDRPGHDGEDAEAHRDEEEVGRPCHIPAECVIPAVSVLCLLTV